MENNKSTFGLEQNQACAICYATWIVGLIILVSEKNDKRVRFHAIQSLIVGVAFTILANVLLFVLALIGLGLLSNIIYLAYLALIIYVAYNAFKGKDIELPFVGPIARKNA